MKRIFRLDRLRLRGLSGARDEVLLTATAQNLRRLVKFLCRPATKQRKKLQAAPVGKYTGVLQYNRCKNRHRANTSACR
jgi:hypothetical protein